MDKKKVIILNGEKHFKLDVGDEVESGDIYESASGRYEEPPIQMIGMEVPGDHVNYYRPVRNTSVELDTT